MINEFDQLRREPLRFAASIERNAQRKVFQHLTDHYNTCN
jgi:hypothetical protein